MKWMRRTARVPHPFDSAQGLLYGRDAEVGWNWKYRGFLSALFVLLAAVTVCAGFQDQPQHSAAFRSMQEKIAYLQKNAARSAPDPKPTVITQDEANAYFAEGGVRLPKGVNSLKLAAEPGVIDAHAQVDFDAITQKARTSNPLLGVFTGLHDVHAIAQASGRNGTGTITIQHVFLDNLEVPQIALQFFVDRYLKARYPNVGLTSTFKLPLRIDTASVESAKVSLVQK